MYIYINIKKYIFYNCNEKMNSNIKYKIYVYNIYRNILIYILYNIYYTYYINVLYCVVIINIKNFLKYLLN